jgi:hypothetical protein
MSDLPKHMSHGTAAALRLFSNNANRTVLHALDRQRWFDFLLAAHREESRFTADDLEEWLIGEGWSSDEAAQLALQYEFARALLRHSEGYSI